MTQLLQDLNSFCGACYLEKGFDFCENKVVKHIIVPYFDLDSLTTQTHNFKSKVLEWAQKEKMKINFIVEKTSESSRFSQFKSILKFRIWQMLQRTMKIIYIINTFIIKLILTFHTLYLNFNSRSSRFSSRFSIKRYTSKFCSRSHDSFFQTL